MTQQTTQIKFCIIFFYTIKACTLRDILKQQDITHVIAETLSSESSYIHTEILCHHHWDISIHDQPHRSTSICFSYFQAHYKGRLCYPGSWYNCSSPNATRAERWNCLGFRTAATASLYTTVAGLRLTPLLWSHLRQLLTLLCICFKSCLGLIYQLTILYTKQNRKSTKLVHNLSIIYWNTTFLCELVNGTWYFFLFLSDFTENEFISRWKVEDSYQELINMNIPSFSELHLQVQF